MVFASEFNSGSSGLMAAEVGGAEVCVKDIGAGDDDVDWTAR